MGKSTIRGTNNNNDFNTKVSINIQINDIIDTSNQDFFDEYQQENIDSFASSISYSTSKKLLFIGNTNYDSNKKRCYSCSPIQ